MKSANCRHGLCYSTLTIVKDYTNIEGKDGTRERLEETQPLNIS
jgi:hypothetical protein